MRPLAVAETGSAASTSTGSTNHSLLHISTCRRHYHFWPDVQWLYQYHNVLWCISVGEDSDSPGEEDANFCPGHLCISVCFFCISLYFCVLLLYLFVFLCVSFVFLWVKTSPGEE